MAEQPASVVNDPRWRKFVDKGFDCSCGEKHLGLIPIEIQTPIGWPGSRDYEPDDALHMDGDFLSANYCVRQGKYFALRCRLPVPVAGDAGWTFLYTAWVNLDRPEFEAYLKTKREGKLSRNNRARARLVNRLSGWPDTNNLVGTMVQAEDGGLPILFVHGLQADGRADHPMIVQQITGIGVDRMLELLAVYGHDMKDAAAKS